LQGLELKPRLGSEIVDAAFQLYRRHFAELITLSALTFGVYAIVQLALTGRPLTSKARAGTSLK
jgi:hypothetical protein